MYICLGSCKYGNCLPPPVGYNRPAKGQGRHRGMVRADLHFGTLLPEPAAWPWCRSAYRPAPGVPVLWDCRYPPHRRRIGYQYFTVEDASRGVHVLLLSFCLSRTALSCLSFPAGTVGPGLRYVSYRLRDNHSLGAAICLHRSSLYIMHNGCACWMQAPLHGTQYDTPPNTMRQVASV